MGLVNAKCPNCGANIKIDADKEAGICEFCGSAFITEKAISNYNITNNYSIQNSTVQIMQEAVPVEMVKVVVGRENVGEVLSSIAFDIVVDGVDYATISSGQIIEINIDKNRQHRIQCVAKCSFGETIKSNVVFFDIGKMQNLKIKVIPGKKLGDYHKIELYEEKDSSQLRAEISNKNLEVENSKKRKKIIIITTIILAILLPIIFITCSISSANNDLKRYNAKMKEYVIGYDNSYIVITYNITNNSSMDREYQIGVEVFRPSDNLIVANGTSKLWTKIKKGETREIAVVCTLTTAGKAAGYTELNSENVPPLNARISAISVDRNILYS